MNPKNSIIVNGAIRFHILDRMPFEPRMPLFLIKLFIILLRFIATEAIDTDTKGCSIIPIGKTNSPTASGLNAVNTDRRTKYPVSGMSQNNTPLQNNLLANPGIIPLVTNDCL